MASDHVTVAEEEYLQSIFWLQEAGLPVEFQDERLSTVSAHEALIAGGMRREERRGTVDKVAAAVILQQYLDKNRR